MSVHAYLAKVMIKDVYVVIEPTLHSVTSEAFQEIVYQADDGKKQTSEE